MTIGYRSKTPADVRLYTINWARFLSSAGTTIASSSFTVDAGLTKDAQSNTTTTATVKVSGGTLGNVYEVENTVTCANGEIKKVKFVVRVEE